MKNMYVITYKRSHGNPEVLSVVASTSDIAIERGRIQLWKNNKWHNKSEWDVIGLIKSETRVAV